MYLQRIVCVKIFIDKYYKVVFPIYEQGPEDDIGFRNDSFI